MLLDHKVAQIPDFMGKAASYLIISRGKARFESAKPDKSFDRSAKLHIKT